MRKPGTKSRILHEMVNILRELQGNRPQTTAKAAKVKGKTIPPKAQAPLITWVAARINPNEYFPAALHDLAAYLLWINAVSRFPPTI